MVEIRKMAETDRTEIMAMVQDFYSTDAVSHPVDLCIMEKSFEDAVGEEQTVWGITLLLDGTIAGYAYLTLFYSCEVGGRVIMLEELYMKESCRGKGIGSQFLQWMHEQYKEVKRFRLEVTEANKNAISLYKKMGFKYLDYGQMVWDR